MAYIQLPSSVQNAKVLTYLRSGENIQAVVPLNPLGVTTGSLTASGQTVVADCTDAGGAVIAITGTFSLTVAFEASLDNSNWFSVLATRSDSATPESSSGSLTSARAWYVDLSGFAYFRVRCTAYTSGTGAVAISLTHTAPVASPAARLAAGSAAVGDVGTQYRANATGAATIRHFVAAAGTNATNVKSSAGRLIGWCLSNTTSSWRYFKLHNTSGTPTAGSGVVQTIGLPPNSTMFDTLEGGIAYSTGIAFTTVTGAADSDTTGVSANDIVGDLFYA